MILITRENSVVNEGLGFLLPIFVLIIEIEFAC